MQSRAQTTTKDIKTIDVNGVPTIQIPAYNTLLQVIANDSAIVKAKDQIIADQKKKIRKQKIKFIGSWSLAVLGVVTYILITHL